MSALLADSVAANDAPSAAPALPARLGRYEVVSVLGEGAMGVVYKAQDPQLARTVALKTIRKSLLGSQAAGLAATVRLRNEAQAAARLSHPGIVSVYEYGEDGDQSFIAMEYVHGTPLLAGMARPEGLPVDDVLCLMVQLLAALQCAHEQGVWHRDIKPANLMITPAGRLKIADFGIARIDAVALTQDASVMGSPGYMAPECYSGVGVDQRADLYACGVLLYELLVGVRPFRGGPDIVMYKTLHVPAPSLERLERPSALAPELLIALAPVVQRALAKCPADRYASALEMREALMSAIGRAVPNALSTQAMALLAPGAMHARGVSLPASRPRSLGGAVAPSSQDAAPAAAAEPPREPVDAPRDAAAVPASADAEPTVLTPTPEPAPAAASASPPVPAPRFDGAWLDRLAADLATELGPIAPCLVRRAAARSADAAALLLRVANDALAPDQRAAFIERHRVAHAGVAAAAPASAPPPGAALPVLGETPLDPALIADAQALIARRLGPIAVWMVRRAAANARTREHFIARLADLAAEGAERERLMAALCRLR